MVALRLGALGLALSMLLGVVGTAWAKPTKDKEPELPPAPARIWVVAPSAQGQWLLRIDNEGDEPLRIAADTRLLRLEVTGRDKRGKWQRRPEICDGTSSFGLGQTFPADRELLLEPGQSWVEQFDPRLICFGAQAKLLTGGARVVARFGWPELPRWQKARKEHGTVAVDATQAPRRYAPRRELVAPPMLLSYMPAEPWARTIDQQPFPPAKDKHKATPKPGHERTAGAEASSGSPGSGAATAATHDAANHRAPTDSAAKPGEGAATGEPAEPGKPDDAGASAGGPKDALGSRLSLTAGRYADGLYPRDVVVSVQIHNAGERSGPVALRGRQLSFRVQGPDGIIECPRKSLSHVVPPDLFGRLAEGKHTQIDVLIAEICPRDAFRRPGLYVAMPTIHAIEVDREKRVGAITGEVTTLDPGPVGGPHRPEDDATLIRIRRGSDAHHARKPAVLPTSALGARPAFEEGAVDDAGAAPTDAAPGDSPAPSRPPDGAGVPGAAPNP